MLKEIYDPIKKELKEVGQVLEASLMRSKNQSILKMTRFLLESPGKRIRSAMVILSAKASFNHQPQTSSDHLIKIASAIELIHMASLIHDDVIDRASLRRNRPTVNSRWGQDVSITLGDYLYSVAFELISDCGSPDIISCISSATKAMCEGELLQVCERDNLNLLKERYIVIVKKKTASLFAASCQAGSLISCTHKPRQNALKEYGLNFGIAFQIVDDYLDLVGDEESLGKRTGQDIRAGEITLPILNLWESISREEKNRLKILLASSKEKEALRRIKKRLFDSRAAVKTKKTVFSFINSAKEKIAILSHSTYKDSLLNLADFIMERGFNDKSQD